MNDLQTQTRDMLEVFNEPDWNWQEPAREEFPLAGSHRLSNGMRQFPSAGEDENRLMRHQAQTERLAVIGLSVTDFTHECRNEMASLKMGLEVLENLHPKETETLEIIGYIKNSEIRLHRLFEDIREYAGPVNLDLAQNQLSEIWRRAWQSLRPARGERDAEIEEVGCGSP